MRLDLRGLLRLLPLLLLPLLGWFLYDRFIQQETFSENSPPLVLDIQSPDTEERVETTGEQENVEVLLRQLHLAELMGRIDLVRNALRRLQAVAPNDPDTLFFDAYQHLYSGDSEKANAVLDRMQMLLPDNPRTAQLGDYIDSETTAKEELQRARLLATAGRYNESLEIYDSLFPRGRPTLSLELEYLNIQGRISERWLTTRQNLVALNDRYPDFPPIELALADHIASRYKTDVWVLETYKRLARGSGLGRQAASSWLRLLGRLPLTDRLLEDYALLASRFPGDLDIQENYKRALVERAAEKERMKNPHYRARKRGLAQLEANQLDAALRNLQYALIDQPEDEEIQGGLGVIYLRRGEQERAINYFRAALRYNSNPDLVSKWQNLLNTSRYWAGLKRADRLIDSREFVEARRELDNVRALNPRAHYVYLRLAELALAEGDPERAEYHYRQVLTIAPLNTTALWGRVQLQLDAGNNSAALAVLDEYTARQRAQIADRERAMRVDFALASLELAQRNGQSREVLEAVVLALALEPTSPWQRSDIAQALVDAGHPERADELMEQWVSDDPDAEMLYAYALYLSSRDRVPSAIDTLESIPVADRSAAMSANLERLRFDQQFAAVDSEDSSAIARQLDVLEQEYSGQPDALLRIARRWLAIDEPRRARHILDGMQPTTDWPFARQLTYADLLLDSGDIADFNRWYVVMVEQTLEPSERRQLDTLNARDLLRRARLNEADQNSEVAYAFYQQSAAIEGRHQLPAQLGVLRLTEEVAGRSRYQEERSRLLAAMPGFESSQLGELAQGFQDSRDAAARQQVLRELVNRPDASALDFRNAMLVSEQAEDWESTERFAVASLAKASGSSPNESPKVLYQKTGDDWLTRSAKAKIDKVRDRTDGHIIVGLDHSVREGKEATFQIPVELRLPVPRWNGHLLARLDYVNIDTGTVDYIDRVTLNPLTTQRLDFSEKTSGVAVGIGWQADRWWADVGTSPIGFREQNWVGGVGVKGSLANVGWRLNLSRRAEVGTALSYAGMEVPATASNSAGTDWGGVLRSGVKLGLSYDRGGAVGYWGSLQYHKLQGERVEDNTRLGVLGGVYWRAYESEPHNWRFGVNFLHLQYDKNLELRALTHGGYFSPQNYLSVSLPVRYFGRRNQVWAYMLGASVGQSWKTEDAPFGFGEGSSKGGGFGYALEAALEKRVSKRWYLGITGDIQRADFYEPNHFQVYARYTFNDRWQPIPTPPEPPILYSSFD
ncbi:MAG TPA: cellulose synthase [Spongiibacteraceae bacterium]|nr:cellulose synthase [Spongiibacteraceae bacterium]HCS26989.1 cellulose synthase [Spongiibacteraceae bacterium]